MKEEKDITRAGGKKATQGRQHKKGMVSFFGVYDIQDALTILGSLEHRILCQHVSWGGSQVVM